MNFNRLRSWAPLIAVVAFAFCFPLITRDAYILSLVIPGLIWAVTCMAWTMIMRTGQFSMGQGAFMALGAYASALLTVNLNISGWLGLLVGGVFSAFIALLLGMAVLRLGGIYFAIVTIAFGEAVRVITLNLVAVTEGFVGLVPPPLRIVIGSYTINFVISKVPYYYVALILVIIAGLVFWRIDRSRLGRIFRSVSSNVSLSEHLGMHLMKYRVIAFTVAGFFTGVAGALFIQYLSFIGPTTFGLWQSIMVLIMCTVGGTGSAVAGPILGALVLSTGGDYLAGLIEGAKPLILGGLVVIIAFLLPGGLVDLRRYFPRVGYRREKA